MSALSFPPYTADNFEASATEADGAVTLTLKGSAEMQVVEGLGPLLRLLHDQVQVLGVKQVKVDFDGLQFMNSSCFKCFVTWITHVQELEGRPYTIQFLSNPRFRWQRASLTALSCLAPDVVEIQASV